uniref:Uncharacterized protein n=1 Tax=Oryza sativa subsp. japonica TaxID=39947 RepID=Q6YWZ6_ORYSJ|nr:hypothetical protein [Oryza sativa Japonica Group]BAC99884.1 hypothetical protein [Oryza sativa Japonica Group]
MGWGAWGLVEANVRRWAAWAPPVDGRCGCRRRTRGYGETIRQRRLGVGDGLSPWMSAACGEAASSIEAIVKKRSRQSR